MIALADGPVRVDEAGRYREEASFIVVRGQRVFSMAHLPSAPARAGFIICPPILMDLVKNYRQEVLLARFLAAKGIAVQRFHYRGTGHSEGDDSEVSTETMVEDTLAMAERLRGQQGVPLAFLGTRWGAHVAAAAAHRYPGAPLILWEPVGDPGTYFRELIRARLIRETKDPRFARMSGDEVLSGGSPQTRRWKNELARDGRADILGYALWRRFFEAGSGQQLGVILAASGGRPVLLVQISRQTTARADIVNLKQAIEEASGTCDIRLIRDDPGWMFDGNHRMKEVATLLQVSADWLMPRTGAPHG